MNSTEIREMIQRELPAMINDDPIIRDYIVRTVSQYYAGKADTESKFDRILNELQKDREEQARKWEENNRKWDENSRRWEENDRKLDELIREGNRKWKEQNDKNERILLAIEALDQKHDKTLGALGARWGINSERSFRAALQSILEKSFGVEVLNINDFDEAGKVFGSPDQIEIDILIQNGTTIACEIKSSVSKSDVFIFQKKVEFYEERHTRPVSRKIIISPMVDSRATSFAEKLGIEIYSDSAYVPMTKK